IGFAFKVWLAQWVAKGDLALFNSVVDLISLSLILMTGFRSSMVVRAVGSNSEAYSDDRESKGVEVTLMFSESKGVEVTLMFRVSCFSCYQAIRGKRTITLR
ncbi:TPA: hypothetical protein ACSP3I_004408, partial [Aeromonas hydrophila]